MSVFSDNSKLNVNFFTFLTERPIYYPESAPFFAILNIARTQYGGKFGRRWIGHYFLVSEKTEIRTEKSDSILHFSFDFRYSIFKLSTGFAEAARTACALTVRKARPIAKIPIMANTRQFRSIR